MSSFSLAFVFCLTRFVNASSAHSSILKSKSEELSSTLETELYSC